jgi:pimeloyl-ACP methyl ester carboxylesterase
MGFRSCITAVFVSVVLLIGMPCTAIGQPGDAQDNSVALQVFSEGEGSPMVMLGGGTFGAAAFAPHAKVLATQFRVVRLQTLNVGTSQQKEPLPPGYSVKLESGAMRRALDKLGISMPIDLVGQSFGALVGLDFALDHPHRVRTLVLFEPPAFWTVPPEELRNTPDMRRMYANHVTISHTLVGN